MLLWPYLFCRLLCVGPHPGAVLGLEFSVSFEDLPRVQIECDMIASSPVKVCQPLPTLLSPVLGFWSLGPLPSITTATLAAATTHHRPIVTCTMTRAAPKCSFL